MILLDTHSLYWLATNDDKLGTNSRSLITHELAIGGVTVSAISFWEIAMLARKGRIAARDVDELRRMILGTGIVEIALDGVIAVLAVQIEALHKDPADRFIAATAMRHHATLITADEKLLAGPPDLKCHDART